GPEALRGALGLVAEPAPLATVRRTLTHRDLELVLFRCGPMRRTLDGYAEQRRVAPDALGTLGISTAMRAAIEALGTTRSVTARSPSRGAAIIRAERVDGGRR
ncbi:MAG: hypothetical protein ACK4N5_11055, partial [Myxococcales bacterium]